MIPTDNTILNDLMTDQGYAMIDVYIQEGLSGFTDLLKCIQTRKQLFKDIIKTKTGKNIRKTPKRCNKLLELQNKLTAISNAFERNADNDVAESSTGAANSKCPTNLQDGDAVISTPTSRKYYRSPRRLSPAQEKRGFDVDFNIIGQKMYGLRATANFGQQTNKVPTNVPSQLTAKPSRKSDVIRKLEAKQRAAVSNKEEIMKIKAEKVRRDREERARRVLENNKKKEEEREAAIKAIRQRELALDEFRRCQTTPAKGLPKSILRVNSRTPSRIHLLRGNAHNDACTASDTEKTLQLCQCQNSHKRKAVAASPAVSLKRAIIRFENEFCNEAAYTDSQSIATSGVAALNDLKVDDPAKAGLQNGITSTADDCDALENNGKKVSPLQASKASGDVVAIETNVATAAKAVQTTGVFDENMEQKDAVKSENSNSEMDATKEKLDSVDSTQQNVENITACSSSEMFHSKKLSCSTEEDYNIDDLSSGDETDDEDRPRKRIPLWAQKFNLYLKMKEQARIPPNLMDSFFGPIETPDISKIFPASRSKNLKRTSSAVWLSPLQNPRVGISLYFALQSLG
uniref:INCENP_ARK-bind domain-containing protein n=1 Tax=Syphacia muris TaxID=451379 RepID=A0A0N5AX71_9BILA